MQTRQEIFNALMDLDFAMVDISKPFGYDDIDVVIMPEGTSQVLASSPRGQYYITVVSVGQLEYELTKLLGYRRTEGGFL
jgi:hypothetical protein